MLTSGFKTPLRVEAFDSKIWVLLDDLIWQGSPEHGADVFVVNAGEETDFATVPWWTQSLIPRTGTWTKAAVLHDKMCNELNAFRRERGDPYAAIGTLSNSERHELKKKAALLPEPRFSAVDTDAIFRKNARDEGTDPIRSELLWLGVRYGALANAARRSGWLSTAPRVLLDTLAVLVALVAFLAGVSWAWPW